MSGSRLGRGRVGRLALLGCGTVSVLIIMFLYKSTSSEMARLRDLHVKCAQQQEALATQLQVIYDYKIQLEKTLSNEKSANAAVKEELQQKATRERSLRDKDSLEAMQRFNALQQNYKLLQTEHQDLKDDCKKKEDVALENAKRLEATLLELRQQQKKAAEEQERSTEHLKNKYLALQQEHQQLEEKYNSLKKLIAESDGNVDHLQKQVIQLQRELEEAKKTPHFSVGGLKTDNLLLQRPVNDNNNNNNNDENVENEKPAGVDNNSMQVIRPSSQQQASVSASNPLKLAAAAPAEISGPLESSSRASVPERSSTSVGGPLRQANARAPGPAKVKLPQGVPPIPRLFESRPKDDSRPAASRRQQLLGPPEAAAADSKLARPAPKLQELQGKEPEQLAQRLNGPDVAAEQVEPVVGHADLEQEPDRRAVDGWYKLKAGVQEVGDPHHLEKNGFANAVAREDVEQYEDYNYKEPPNKNSDIHLEEGEDEREDEDDYMHNNVVKQE